MCEFATLESPYSMPVALHGDLDLTDPEAQTRSRALNQFLAGVELKAFKIAQAALRHEDDGRALARGLAAPAAPGVSAADARGHGRRRDGARDGLLGRQRQDTLLSRAAGAARRAWGFSLMHPVNEPLTDFERNARVLLE